MLRNKRRNKSIYSDGNERVDTMGTNIYSSKDNQSMHKSLNGQFILYQILLQRLLDDELELSKIDQDHFRNYFKPSNPIDEEIMKEFDREYKSEQAIHWYTRETCIYRILNKALRTQNIDDIIAFEQFVRDLNQQLKDEYKKFKRIQKSSILTVYRGQLISKDEINRLKHTKGELLSMNSFLSTSTNKDKALEFATSRIPPNDDLTSILLEISVNIQSPSRPLADIKYLSAFSDEEEILFMFGCVFRIDDIWYDEQINLWKAKLTLCGENDSDMNDFSLLLNNELHGKNKQVALGIYLFQMQKYEEAEEHYHKLLDNNQVNDPIQLAYCHHGLAQVNQIKQEYKSAIDNLNKALDYLLKNSPNNDHILISQCYNDLGSVYSQQDNHVLGFTFFDIALTTINNNHSITYSHLAKMHMKMKNYELALEYLQKVIEILPEPKYPLIATTYIDMGKIYSAMNKIDDALEMFDKAIETQKNFFNSDHPDMGYTYAAQGMMYSDIGDEEKAFEYIEKAFKLQSESLPNNHPDFGRTYKNFGDLYMKRNDLDQALSYYMKTLENQFKSFLWNHPAVAETHRLIGNIYWQKKDYNQALNHFHEVLDSELDRYTFGNSILTITHKTIGDIYLEQKDLNQALDYYHKVLDNELVTKLYEDVSLIDIYKTIADIYYRKRLLNKSLLYYHRLLDCHFRQEPFNESILSEVYTMIGKVYLKKSRFDETLLYYKQKLDKKTSNNKSSLEIYKDIDNSHFEKRHLDQALNYFENQLEQQIKNYSLNHSLINETYQILGNIYLEKHNYDKSLKCFHKLLDEQLKIRFIHDPTLINLYNMIGNIYFEKQNYDRSLSYFYRLIDCLLRIRPFNDPSIINIYKIIGKIYLNKHDFNYTINDINKLTKSSTNKKLIKTTSFHKNNIHFEKRHLDQSLFFFHKLLQRKSIYSSLKLFNLDSIYIIIGYIHSQRHDPYQALFYFHKLLNLQLEKQPLGDISIANTYSLIADTYFKAENYNEALTYYQNSLQIYQRIKPLKEFSIAKIKYKIQNILLPYP